MSDQMSDWLVCFFISVDFLHASEVLSESTSSLSKKLKWLDLGRVEQLVQRVSLGVIPTSQCMDHLLEHDEKRWVSTGDQSIDEMMGGGIRRGVITEIVGQR